MTTEKTWWQSLRARLSRAIWLRRLRNIERGTRRQLSRLYLQQRVQETEAPMTLTEAQRNLLEDPTLEWSQQQYLETTEDLQMSVRQMITLLTATG